MPSTSAAQHRLMEMVAHGGKPDQVKAPPVKVAREFAEADRGKKRFSMSKERAKAAALRKPKLPPGVEGAEGAEGGV